MKNCLNCANYICSKNKWQCKTMTAPMEKYKCHMTKERLQKTEDEIAAYTISKNGR